MNIIFGEEIENFKNVENTDLKLENCKKITDFLSQKNIVIYGGGAAGSTLTLALKEHGITPEFIVDRKFDVIKEVHNCKVFPPEKLKELDAQNSVVIIAINAYVIRNFNNETYQNIEKFLPDANVIEIGADVTNMLNYTKCEKKLRNGEPFNIVNCLNCGAETKCCGIYERYLKKIAKLPQERNITLSKKFDWFGYIMGQYCTLNCKHCCEHVPYMKNKTFAKKEQIIADCTKIAQASEFIRYIELIGGEPFLHPELAEVVKGLLEIENVGYVKIFTNGTVVPKEDMRELLKNPRVVLTFSNYMGQVDGKLADNITQLREMLKADNIDYVFSESKMWTDWGDFHDRGRSDEETERNAANCFCYNCHRAFNGILYRCPHQYAGIIQGFMEYKEGEYIDLEKTPPEKMGEALEAFENLKYTEGCKRCDMPYDCPEVPAAIQL
ncbi:MAG: radical SAM protein [Clostridiales bacterium]|nr:radical SAM protein [Clostridiales bacterium]